MQVPGQVVPELNDSSCRDGVAGGMGERQATAGRGVLRRRTMARGGGLGGAKGKKLDRVSRESANG